MTITIVPQSVSVSAAPQSFSTSPGNPITRDYVERDPYTGEYTITPGAAVQTLLTKDLRMTYNVTIEAIPENYGLITWNGSTLTVS